MRLSYLFAGLFVIALAGCGGGGGAVASLPTADGMDLSVRRLREAARRTSASDSVLALSLRRAGGTPLFGSRFRLASGVYAGFVPGQHPPLTDELVVVGAERGTTGATALLEATRVLVARSAYSARPARTVLVAFWPEGTDGLAATLRAPVWEDEHIRSAWVVAGDTARVRQTLAALRLPGGVVDEGPRAPEPLAEAERLTRLLLAHLDRVTAAPVADTLSTPMP